MIRKLILPIICMLLPLVALIASGCGFFSFPFDGTKAAATNFQYIKLRIPIVDQDGQPLDDVEITITRRSLEANIIMPGTFDQTKPPTSRVVSKELTYDSLGNCALDVSFSKAGYGSANVTYSNVDQIKPTGSGFLGPRPHSYACVNVTKACDLTVVLQKAQTTTRP